MFMLIANGVIMWVIFSLVDEYLENKIANEAVVTKEELKHVGVIFGPIVGITAGCFAASYVFLMAWIDVLLA